jgi:2,3-bisphosphoglycerate-independent phosphoglycerate mutase
MAQGTRPRPVVLCILDGWGHRETCEDNAIDRARTPVLNRLVESAPHALIDASELAVGLPSGQMGNSEVGHMNLGAGRVVVQDLPRIDQALAEGALTDNPALAGFMEALRGSGGTAHLLGLLSPGGVHSHQNHIAALANVLTEAGLPVAVHGFLDGRDTPPRSARGFVADFLATSRAPIATLCGRYYAMDRDRRWERVEQAYDALVEARGKAAPDPLAAITQGYEAGQSDEFLAPSVIGGFAGMADGDGVIMANFRADRAREILSALLVPNFEGFARPRIVRFETAAGMVSYSEALDARLATLFPPLELRETLGEVVAEAGLEQLRIAETEKYAHVTFFFNGGRETVFPGEARILVPSPRVATYDLKPEMSAVEVTDELVEAIGSGRFDLIVANYANGDMVGHTGDLCAAVRAVEAVDTCLGRLTDAVGQAGGALIITADHGNAEQMMDHATGQAHTAHTMNPVPVILANAPAGVTALAGGRLADVAPTLLDLMGLAQPPEMTGRSLLRRAAETGDAAAE